MPSEFPTNPLATQSFVPSPLTMPLSLSAESTKIQSREASPVAGRREYQSADQLNSRLPPHLLALRHARSGSGSSTGTAPLASPIGSSPPSSPERDIGPSAANASSAASSVGGGATGVNRRRSLLAMTSTGGSGRERQGSASSDAPGFGGSIPNAGPPILANPKCSGYFVEPVRRALHTSLLELLSLV